jgi:hypothetical protein
MTDYPALFVWCRDATGTNFPDIFSTAKSDGGDIRFTSDMDGVNELACDIAYYSEDFIEIWVKIPSVSIVANNLIKVWWGNPAAIQRDESHIYGKNAVWEKYSQAEHVYEFIDTGVTRSRTHACAYEFMVNNTDTRHNKSLFFAGSNVEESDLNTINYSIGYRIINMLTGKGIFSQLIFSSDNTRRKLSIINKSDSYLNFSNVHSISTFYSEFILNFNKK